MIRTRQRALMVAYQRGAAACKIGLPMESCPYPLVVDYRKFWEKGFADEQHKRDRLTRKMKRNLSGLVSDR
ncbi:MAG TPA: Rmf/CrpP family protein [Steroidobacteraceae bacterium]|nr:Rmf/CrpP family protein [Steroidobacteraceae bacterium]